MAKKKETKKKRAPAAKRKRVGSARGTVGRKSVYETRIKPNLDEILDLYARGITKKQIAAMFGFSESSFYESEKQFSEFSESLARARVRACDEVLGAMFKLAVGYKKKRMSKRIMPVYDRRGNKVKDAEGKDLMREVACVEEIEIEPNVNAQLAFLKNVGGWSDNPVVDNAIAKSAEEEQERTRRMLERLGIRSGEKMRSTAKDAENLDADIVSDADLDAMGA